MKNILKGFSFVEIIIVIMILGVLSTISYLVYKEHFDSANDAATIGSISTILTSLTNYQYTNSALPIPDKAITLTSSGNNGTIGYQGFFGSNVKSLVKGFDKIPLDKDGNQFIYRLNKSLNKAQILGYLINENIQNGFLFNNAYASGFSNKHIKTIGDSLGILITDDNQQQPINYLPSYNTATTLDISTINQSFKIIFSETGSIIGTGGILLNALVINNKDLNKEDGNLIGYRNINKTIGKFLQDEISNNKCSNNSDIHIEEGINEGGLKLNGNNNGLTCSTNNDYKLSEFSVSLRFNIKSFKNSDMSLISYENGTKYNYEIFIKSNKTINASSTINNGSKQTISGIGELNTNKYYNAVYTYKNNIGKLYLNGNLINSLNFGNSVDIFDGNLYIGGLLSKNNLFNGLLDEIRLYKRQLSDSEIINLYNAK